MNNRVNKRDDNELSEFTYQDTLGMIDLVNKKYDDIKKGGKIITQVEKECEKKAKYAGEAIEKIFTITDADEEIKEILEETPNKSLQRYAEKVIDEEIIETNKELASITKGNIEEIKEIYMKKIEDEFKTLNHYLEEFKKKETISEDEKEKIKNMIHSAVDQDDILTKDLLKKFDIGENYTRKAKNILGHIRSLKTEISNFRYNAKQRLNQLMIGLFNLDDDIANQRDEKLRGEFLIKEVIKQIDDLCSYYNEELKNMYT